MLIVVSPAKSLDYESALATRKYSEPRLLDQAEELVGVMAAKAPSAIQEMMHISAELAELNFERFQDWQRPFERETARPAVLAFAGDVYMGLDAPGTFTERDFTEAQKTFRILSGLYGVLRPLDLMMPYRLEMGTQLPNRHGSDLYAYWRADVTDMLRADLEASPGADALVNLASNEYFGAVDSERLGRRVISPVFLDSKDGGPYKIVSFFAKKARGAMSQYLIKNRVRTLRGIKGFEGLGYRFEPSQSSADRPVFIREY